MGPEKTTCAGVAQMTAHVCDGCMYVLVNRCQACGMPLCRYIGMPEQDRGLGGNGGCQMLPHYNHNGRGYCCDCHARARHMGGM
jgi:hypothetical protein